MALGTFEDIIKVEELLKIREEYSKDNSLKGEIINEGVKTRLTAALALQTTLLGRIESNPPDYTEIYLREQDAPEELKKKYQLNKEKKIMVIPVSDFLNELKLAFKNNVRNEINKLQVELEKISRICSD